MLTISNIALMQAVGFAGALISAAAFLPQIVHLIQEQCSAGISRKAYWLWLIAAIALFANAIAVNATVFVLLTGLQIIADAIILIFAYRYKDYENVCVFHASCPPTP